MPDAAIVRDTIESVLRDLPAALDPYVRTRRVVARLGLEGNIRIVAIGKAARPMARAAIDALGERVIGGVVVAPETTPVPPLDVRMGSHPLPDARSEAAGRAALAEAGRSDHARLLVLVSGGGSSMAEVPKPPLDIATVAEITDRLMRSGAPIDELNVVRRHLSDLKNGALAGRSKVPVTTLVISDVVDGPPSLVASGPTLADDSTALRALAILERRLGRPVPSAVHAALARPIARRRVEPAHVVADRHTAYAEAAHRLERAGVGPTRPMRLEGDAAAMARRMLSMKGVTVGTGETTVRVTGPGTGGRNQHAALVGAVVIDGTEAVFGTLGTDGIDGPTDAAGAVVDGTTVEKIRAGGVDPARAIADCDSHLALDAAGVLIRTGATGTNVADVWIASVP